MIPVLAACEGSQSALAPAGPSARMAANLWWGMFAFSTLVLLVVVALWLYAMYRTPRSYDEAGRNRVNRRWIIGGGIILPTVSIAVLLAFGIPAGHRMLPLSLTDTQALRIDVTGHQWRFDVSYPDSGARTGDRMVIPVGLPVDIHVTSADVIHSFWVPRLGGKIDMLPGRTNILRLQADEPGEYRAQCAEFCGTQHAHMMMIVEAIPPEAFEAWLEAERQ